MKLNEIEFISLFSHGLTWFDMFLLSFQDFRLGEIEEGWLAGDQVHAMAQAKSLQNAS